MNTTNITNNSPLVSVRSAEVHAGEGLNANSDFMSIVSQLTAQNGEGQITEISELLVGEKGADPEVIDELVKLLTQYGSQSAITGGIEGASGQINIGGLPQIQTDEASENAEDSQIRLIQNFKQGFNPNFVQDLKTKKLKNDSEDVLQKLAAGNAAADLQAVSYENGENVTAQESDIVNVKAAAVMEDKANVMEDKTNAMDGKINVMEDKANALDSKISIMEDKANAMDGKINVMEDKANAMDSKINVMEDKANAMDGKTSVMEDTDTAETPEKLGFKPIQNNEQININKNEFITAENISNGVMKTESFAGKFITPNFINAEMSVLGAETAENPLLSFDAVPFDSENFLDFGTDTVSSVISALLDEGDDNALTNSLNLTTSLPLKALYELAKINVGKSELEVPENFSLLDNDEKLQIVTQAIADGKLTIEKETDFMAVADQMKSSYAVSMSKNVENVQENSTETNTVMPSDAMVIDYNADYTMDIPTLRGTPLTEESMATGEVIDSVNRAFEQKNDKVIVRLNPKGLGEIAISLEKTKAGGMIVNIIAQNARTAAILNSQVSNIQENLAKYDAQVNTVTVADNPHNASFGFEQQMFNSPQGNNHSDNSNNRSAYFAKSDSDDEEINIPQRKLGEALNMYA